MKKIIYSMFALMAMTFAACSDVPEPYMNPNNYKGGGGETEEGVYVDATFNSKLDPFEAVTTKGNAWVINYNTATATGYNSSEKTNTESESYLVSPEIDLTASEGAYLEFEYIFRYANRAGEDKVYITSNYSGDPTTTEWTDITGTLTEGSNWDTFAKYSKNLPADFVGKSAVRIALYYNATATDSRTWEVKNLKVREGQVEEGGEEGGEVTPVDGGEGDGTEAAPYNVTAAKAATGNEKWVKAYIVGFINTTDYTYTYSAEGALASNIIIAASPDEKTDANCMPVQLVAQTPVRTGVNLVDNPANLGKEILICGNIETYFTVPGIKSPVYAKIGDKEYGTKPGDTPVEPIATGLYNIDFTKSQTGWTVNDVTLPEGFTSIWTADAKYGYKATAYKSSTNYAGESWLISPKIDLSKATAATLKISHACNFFADVATAEQECTVWASLDGSNWSQVTLTGYPTKMGWDFVDGTADLSAYAGKTNVQIAFKYTSTATKAGTWEIKTVTIE